MAITAVREQKTLSVVIGWSFFIWLAGWLDVRENRITTASPFIPKLYMKFTLLLLPVLGAFTLITSALTEAQTPGRLVLPLDGEWEATQGALNEEPPVEYGHRLVVPGLVDMAEPAFEAPFAWGRDAMAEDIPEDRRAIWYRTSFTLPEGEGEGYAIVRLKIRKARYGTMVWCNGEKIGYNPFNMTPGYFELTPALKGAGKTNELVVRTGTHYRFLPEGIPYDSDWEKTSYLSGIYDSVELIGTPAAYIENVQAVPDIDEGVVRLVVEISGEVESAGERITAKIMADANGQVAGQAEGTRENGKADLQVDLNPCERWSPENPALYRAEVMMENGDVWTMRFGMREFHFDPETKMAVLNGQPRYLVGANAAIFRFMEDPERGDYLWQRDWAKLFYKRCAEMHWDLMRWHISFPPDYWYDLADELGC